MEDFDGGLLTFIVFVTGAGTSWKVISDTWRVHWFE